MATIDQRSNGKWRAQIRNVGFKPVSKSFDRRADAVTWVRKVEAGQQAGEQVDPREQRATSVRSLLERFLAEEVPKRKGQRWETVRIRMLLKEDFTHRRLDQDIPGALRSWVDRRSRDVSAETVRRDLALVSTVFNHAITSWGLSLPHNPVSRVKRPAASNTPVAKVWTDDDLAALRAAYEQLREEEPARNLSNGTAAIEWVLPALELSLVTAMRRTELCSLRVADIDLDKRSAWLRSEDTKTGTGRTVYLSSRACEIVQQLLAMRRPAGDDRLIPVEPDTLGLRFRQLRNRAGLDLRLHDARHTAVTNAAPKLKDSVALAKFSGHKDPRMLMRYLHPDPVDFAARLD